jgi:hypothetical protein
MWKFTKHFLLRIDERNYTQDELLSVLNGDVPAIMYPSPREESVNLYYGQIGNKYLMIPVDIEKKTIITIRPMNKKEKSTFLKETSNDKE